MTDLVRVGAYITAPQRDYMDSLITAGDFISTSAFIRYLIAKHMDDHNDVISLAAVEEMLRQHEEANH